MFWLLKLVGWLLAQSHLVYFDWLKLLRWLAAQGRVCMLTKVISRLILILRSHASISPCVKEDHLALYASRVTVTTEPSAYFDWLKLLGWLAAQSRVSVLTTVNCMHWLTDNPDERVSRPQPGNSPECAATSWCCPDSPERGSTSLRCAEVPFLRCARARVASPGPCSGWSPSRTWAHRRPGWTASPSWAGSRSCLRPALVAVRGVVATTQTRGGLFYWIKRWTGFTFVVGFDESIVTRMLYDISSVQHCIHI